MAKADEVLTVLGAYLEAFPDSKLKAKGLAVYASVLIDYPIEHISVAMKKLIRTAEFFPRVADIVRAIEELQIHVDTNGKGVLTADEAWCEMIAAANRYGGYVDKWVLSTTAATSVARRFAHEVLAMQAGNETSVIRSLFCKAYDGELVAAANRKINNQALNLSDVTKRLAGAKVVMLKNG